ncbi:MAG TPA: hypothetical protein V6D18_13565 [Thermosynechococcaceae cyanobacterium]
MGKTFLCSPPPSGFFVVLKLPISRAWSYLADVPNQPIPATLFHATARV